MKRYCQLLSNKMKKQINTKTYLNSEIIDNREQGNENKKILITCEHASNKLPEGIQWSENDKRNFRDSHWAYDIGTQEFCKNLSERLKCVMMMSKYSRLFCDVNRPISSESLSRKMGDNKIIELNSRIEEEEEEAKRIDYYNSYYKSVRDVQKLLDPDIILSIHSYTHNYEGDIRTQEVGVLYSFDHCQKMAEFYNHQFLLQGFKSAINKPWSGKDGFCFSVDHFTIAKMDKKEAILVEFRNDLLTDKKYSKNLEDIIYNITQQYIQI